MAVELGGEQFGEANGDRPAKEPRAISEVGLGSWRGCQRTMVRLNCRDTGKYVQSNDVEKDMIEVERHSCQIAR